MGGLAFSSPLILIALIAIPAIWFLLRLTPPRPQREVFPPLPILSGILKREETPATSPLWLTLLRLALATLAILAMAGPVLNPRESEISTKGPLVLLVDNDWAAAPQWDKRIETAKALVEEAADYDIPVSVAFTAEAHNDAIAVDARKAIEKLDAAQPRPLPARRIATLAAVEQALDATTPGTLAFISSGVAADEPDLASLLAVHKADEVLLFEAADFNPVAITGIRNNADHIEIDVARPLASGSVTYRIDAYDTKSRIIASGEVSFADGVKQATGAIEAPFELRNDFARIAVTANHTAASTYLLDEGFKRRRVGLLTGESRDLAQPLLSPLFYIRRALSPYADITEPPGGDFTEIIPELIADKPSVIVMADIGRLPEEAYQPLEKWIASGGTLIRFAGPRLASAPADDPLVPVRLRQGERTLSGAMSWIEPQPLAPFTLSSPFAGLPVPQNVTITRQVLAEPSPDLDQHTWASLADGTPLVTGKETGAGRIVLFHTSAEATWSNLALSGSFVEMLRRIVQLSSSSGASPQEKAATLPPYRMLDTQGELTSETGAAKALVLNDTQGAVVSSDNPPGLYGSEDGFQALNLFKPGDMLEPINLDTSTLRYSRAALIGSSQISLRPYLLVAAFVLLIADSLAVLIMQGAFSRRLRRGVVEAAVLFLAVGLIAYPFASRADDRKPGDDKILAAVETTHLAYVLTGEDDVDRVSRAGLRGLSDFLTYRTAFEPGEPMGVNPASDELAFYPIIYWPISASAPMPSSAAISHIGAYMRAGGTVLFDTRDQFSSLDGAGAGANGQRLQDILASLDIPALEAVPARHVLTKSFYLLQDFPGRYSGGALWVEATNDTTESGARHSDGVSSILITSNDFAGAWAVDDQGYPLLPTVPSNTDQREMAFRTGVNIVMYMLTGNYKGDQVHIPALLERLGQ